MDEFSARAVASKENEAEFQSFASENQRFILKCASIATSRIVTINDDEYSVALIAFYEAVRTYDEDRGNFAGFAKMVIKRRLADYYYKEKRHQSEISTTPESFDGSIDPEDASPYELAVSKASNDIVGDNAAASPLKLEVQAIAQKLQPYGFGLYDIGKSSPKIARTKRGCAEVIGYVLEKPERLEHLRRTGNLPFSELVALPHVTKKILDRHRKYIICAIEILAGDYPLLSEYIGKIREV